jgi:DNA-binding PucR family transcriptional regulator
MASVLLDSEDFQLQRQTNDGLLPFTGGTPVGSGPDIFVDATASGEAWVVAPVWLSGDLAARIWAAGRTADLDSLDRRAIEHAATVLALELMRLRTAMEIEWRTAADIVRDLIHGNASVAAALLPRAAGLGHDLDRSHFVVIAQADANSDDLRPSVISIVRAVAATVDPRPLVATVGTNVVALWPATKPEEHVAAADAIRTRFRRARPGATISVTVTPPCQSLHGYPRAYRLGRGLAELAHERGVRDATLQIGDSGPLGLLLQIERAEELVAFSDKILGPLCAYDKRRSASLGQTVAAYFRNNLNTAATAAELHVHPNTVGLRIRRAEEILDLSLTDVDTTVHIGLALMCDEVIAVMGGSADH